MDSRKVKIASPRLNGGQISWSFVDRVLKENDVEVRLR